MHFPSTWSGRLVAACSPSSRRSRPSPDRRSARDPAPTTLTLTAPASGKAGLPAPFTATLTDDDRRPDRRRHGHAAAHRRAPADRTGTTDSNGTRRHQRRAPRRDDDLAGVVRRRRDLRGLDLDTSAASAGVATPAPCGSPVPTRLVDEHVGNALDPLDGRRRLPGQRHRHRPAQARRGHVDRLRRLRTADQRPGHPRRRSAGRLAVARHRRRRLVVARRRLGDLSIDNVPQIAPASYPKAAPRPAATPAQAARHRRRRQRRHHPHPRTPSGARWRAAPGTRGCPVGRSGLRLLRINYWGFDGYRYRGEMVLSTAVARRAAAALRDMYDGRFPIRRMYRVDRFGWSKRAPRRQRLRLDARRQHLGVQLPQRGEQAQRALTARPRPRRRRQHLGEPLPLGHRAGAELVVGLAQPPRGTPGARAHTRW